MTPPQQYSTCDWSFVGVHRLAQIADVDRQQDWNRLWWEVSKGQLEVPFGRITSTPHEQAQ